MSAARTNDIDGGDGLVDRWRRLLDDGGECELHRLSTGKVRVVSQVAKDDRQLAERVIRRLVHRVAQSYCGDGLRYVFESVPSLLMVEKGARVCASVM